jgi:hypothetical protein
MARKRTSENELVVSSNVAAVPARRKMAPVSRNKHVATQPEPASASAIEPAVCEPTREEIAALAYSYWEARGYRSGDPAADWLRAEREIRARAAVA